MRSVPWSMDLPNRLVALWASERSKIKFTSLKVDQALNLALTGWVKVKDNLPDIKLKNQQT